MTDALTALVALLESQSYTGNDLADALRRCSDAEIRAFADADSRAKTMSVGHALGLAVARILREDAER